ncbi:MAG: hypothetical protein U0T56_04560 [Ferruginibacter sp.]|jgi:IS5 family transposase
MPVFTTEELLQYLYREASPEMSASIEAELQNDWSTRERYDQLKATHRQLEEIKHSPRKQTIDFLLQYAGKTEEEVLTTQA